MCNKHKQKILIVHNYYQLAGGEDTVVANEKKLLEDNGHEVIVYSRHNSEIAHMSLLGKMLLPFIVLFNPKTYIEIKQIIKTEGIDIVHVHNTLHLISPAVYYAAVQCGVPVVQTIHNFRFLCPGGTFYRDGRICEDCVKGGLLCAVKNKCYRNSILQSCLCSLNIWLHRRTGILKKINYICLTEFNKKKLALLKWIEENKIYVKPNFTYDYPFVSKEGRLRNYYLYVGRIEEIKGIRILLEAFAKMPKKELLIAGEGPLENNLKTRASKNVTFLGRVKHNVVMKLIANAKALVLPSQVYEGFPMTILEAMSVGTPVVVSNIGNNGVLVENMRNGIKFSYNDVDEFIEAINQLESCDYEKLVDSVRKEYYKRYKSEINYKELLYIYNNVG